MMKKTKRMLSVLMAALMVVSIMPVNGSNNIVAKASTASEEIFCLCTWSAADILAAQEGDSGLVLCGSGWANNNATDDKDILKTVLVH